MWTQVRDNDIFNSYANSATKLRSGDMVKMWYMYDFKQEQSNEGVPFLSKQGQNEYDCKDGRSRIIAYLLFAGNMGGWRCVFFKR